MPRLALSTEWTFHGLRVLTLENELLRIQILPEAGAKIWQITYLPLGEDLLWNNPLTPPARHAIHTRYDDVWSGGWDELFPNDEETVIEGERYPDHGELWSGSWSYETYHNEDAISVTLRFQTPISCIAIQKTITLRKGSACIQFEHCMRNLSAVRFPFLWKLHPALKVTSEHRIDFPNMKVVREPSFPGTLGEAPTEFAWPYANAGDKILDLRQVPEEKEREIHFFYGADMADGWCALTNIAKQISCGLRFDQKIFGSCWLFASYGGWRNHQVAVLEPCTGYPLNFEQMVAAGRDRVLAPGESLSTEVLFSVQQGLKGVSSMDGNGIMQGLQ